MTDSFGKDIMHDVLLWLQRWWRPLVFLFWLIALLNLFLYSRYTAFLRPEFGIIIIMAVLVLIGFLAAELINRTGEALTPPRLLSALILILPLLFLLRAGDTSLDAYAFQKRSLGSPALPRTEQMPQSAQSAQERQSETVPQKAVSIPSPGEQKASTENQLKSDKQASAVTKSTAARRAKSKLIRSRKQGKKDESAQEVSILDLYSNPALYRDKEVEFIGRVHHNDDMKKNFGMDTIVVFRFLVTCCAADAMPLAIVVKSPTGATFNEDTWCKARGIFTIENKDSIKIPFLQKASIADAEKPKQPYMF